MQARGSIIKSIDQFVSDNYNGKYNEWKEKLSDESKTIYTTPSTSQWYPIEDGVIQPTKVLCDMFFKDAKEGAWQSGRYSAEMTLSGVYKIFVLVSTPAFLVKRASRVMSTFYNPADVKVVESTSKSMLIQSSQLPLKNNLIEYRIAGWMEKALEICGCKNTAVTISKSLAKGDNLFEVSITWD